MIVIIDTETTGIMEPRPVEVAWIKLRDLSLDITETFSQRYNPEKPIGFSAMATHNILEEDVAGMPSYKTFALPAGTEYIIGHKVDYDWEAIGFPEVMRIDTLPMARRIWKDADGHSLGALAYMLAKDKAKVRELMQSAHSAMTDVKLCRFVLSRIIKELGITSWEELWTVSEEYRIPETMPFGKHKGVSIKELPADYVKWALGNIEDMDPYLRKALEENYI